MLNLHSYKPIYMGSFMSFFKYRYSSNRRHKEYALNWDVHAIQEMNILYHLHQFKFGLRPSQAAKAIPTSTMVLNEIARPSEQPTNFMVPITLTQEERELRPCISNSTISFAVIYFLLLLGHYTYEK